MAGPGFSCDFAVPLASRNGQAPVTAARQEPASGFAEADGASLYYERRGQGPPVLLISGGGGDAGYYSAIADILAGDFTVLTYDRRGNSRSTLHDTPNAITIPQQSDDAVAVLRACGFGSASVFGNSGGAVIALDLAARHPEAARTVIAHEPPLPRVLPDAGDYLASFDEIDRVLAAEGWRAAFEFFQARIARVPPDRQRETMAILLDPAGILPPGPELDLMTRVSRNWQYMMRYEVRSFIDYTPDFERLGGTQARMVLAAGAESAEPDPRICSIIAGRLGAEFARFPGGHLAPMEIPGIFAARLRPLLGPGH